MSGLDAIASRQENQEYMTINTSNDLKENKESSE